MSLNFAALTAKVSNKVTNVADRRCVLSAAVAQYIANCLPLPSSCVDDLENHYNMNVKSQVLDTLGPLNEQLVLDVKVVQDYTRKYWLLRYNTLYPVSAVKTYHSATYGYFDTMMGVGVYIDPEQHAFVNQYKMEILEAYKDLCLMDETVEA